MRYKKLIALTIAICVCAISAKTVSGQSTEPTYWKEYERALLDTAIRYELLKPVLTLQKQKSNYLENENTDLRKEIKMYQLRESLLVQQYEERLRLANAKARKQRWIGRIEGVAAGLLFPIP